MKKYNSLIETIASILYKNDIPPKVQLKEDVYNRLSDKHNVSKLIKAKDFIVGGVFQFYRGKYFGDGDSVRYFQIIDVSGEYPESYDEYVNSDKGFSLELIVREIGYEVISNELISDNMSKQLVYPVKNNFIGKPIKFKPFDIKPTKRLAHNSAIAFLGKDEYRTPNFFVTSKYSNHGFIDKDELGVELYKPKGQKQ